MPNYFLIYQDNHAFATCAKEDPTEACNIARDLAYTNPGIRFEVWSADTDNLVQSFRYIDGYFRTAYSCNSTRV